MTSTVGWYLAPELIAELQPGDPVSFSLSWGDWGHAEYHTGTVAKLTATQVVVNYKARGAPQEVRVRKADGRLVGQAHGALLDPTHPTVIADFARQAQTNRREHINSLAYAWRKDPADLNALRRLHTAIGEYLDAEQGQS